MTLERVELVGRLLGKPELVANGKGKGFIIKVEVEIQNDIADFDVCDLIAVKGRRRWLRLAKPGTIITAIGFFRFGKFWAESCKRGVR